MPFVNAKCPNCGGTLQVDNSKRAAMCPFCKEAYVVEDAINNYITNNYTTVEHLHADVVNFNSNPDFEIRAGELVAYHGNAVDIIIPDGVKKIGGTDKPGARGTRSCYTIQGAFENCTFLRSVTLPESVEEIGENAFRNCSSLTSISFPKNMKRIAARAFANCESLSHISFSNSSIPLVIQYEAFIYCRAMSYLELPSNIREIGTRAFRLCGLKTLVVHGSPSIERLNYDSWIYDSECGYGSEDGSFASCPVDTLIASEDWKKEYCWNFPSILPSYCRENRRIQLQDSVARYQKKLAEYEEQYHRAGLFAKSERAKLRASIESVKREIGLYQKMISELNC